MGWAVLRRRFDTIDGLDRVAASVMFSDHFASRASRSFSCYLLTMLMTVLVLAGCGAAKVPTGVLTGGIYLSGGPLNPKTGKSACEGTRCPAGGTLTVRNSAGRFVAHAQLRYRQHFRFVLPTGSYQVSDGPACPTIRTTVRAHHTSQANILCNIA